MLGGPLWFHKTLLSGHAPRRRLPWTTSIHSAHAPREKSTPPASRDPHAPPFTRIQARMRPNVHGPSTSHTPLPTPNRTMHKAPRSTLPASRAAVNSAVYRRPHGRERPGHTAVRSPPAETKGLTFAQAARPARSTHKGCCACTIIIPPHARMSTCISVQRGRNAEVLCPRAMRVAHTRERNHRPCGAVANPAPHVKLRYPLEDSAAGRPLNGVGGVRRATQPRERRRREQNTSPNSQPPIRPIRSHRGQRPQHGSNNPGKASAVETCRYLSNTMATPRTKYPSHGRDFNALITDFHQALSRHFLQLL